MKKEHPVILVRKRKSHHGTAHHGGSWKIAYADFMTAMMAFFLVMWLISISTPQGLMQLADYFRTPLKVAITGGTKISTSSSVIPGGGNDPTQTEGEVKKAPKAETKEEREEEARFNAIKDKLDLMLAANARFKELRPHLLINLVDEGLRIEIIDSQNRPMFKVGSANVEPYMRDVLRAIGPILNELPNKISISGHTDDLAYATGERGYSNWELSADRANASRRELVTGGLGEGKLLRIVGMGSVMSLKGQGATDAENRRISILVLNKKTEKSIEHESLDNKSLAIENAENLKQLESEGKFDAPTGSQTAPAPAQPPQSKTGVAPPEAEKPAAPVNDTTPPPTGSDTQQR